MSNIRISRPAAPNPTELTPVAGYQNIPASNTIGDFLQKQGINLETQDNKTPKVGEKVKETTADKLKHKPTISAQTIDANLGIGQTAKSAQQSAGVFIKQDVEQAFAKPKTISAQTIDTNLGIGQAVKSAEESASIFQQANQAEVISVQPVNAGQEIGQTGNSARLFNYSLNERITAHMDERPKYGGKTIKVGYVYDAQTPEETEALAQANKNKGKKGALGNFGSKLRKTGATVGGFLKKHGGKLAIGAAIIGLGAFLLGKCTGGDDKTPETAAVPPRKDITVTPVVADSTKSNKPEEKDSIAPVAEPVDTTKIDKPAETDSIAPVVAPVDTLKTDSIAPVVAPVDTLKTDSIAPVAEPVDTTKTNKPAETDSIAPAVPVDTEEKADKAEDTEDKAAPAAPADTEEKTDDAAAQDKPIHKDDAPEANYTLKAKYCGMSQYVAAAYGVDEGSAKHKQIMEKLWETNPGLRNKTLYLGDKVFLPEVVIDGEKVVPNLDKQPEDLPKPTGKVKQLDRYQGYKGQERYGVGKEHDDNANQYHDTDKQKVQDKANEEAVA